MLNLQEKSLTNKVMYTKLLHKIRVSSHTPQFGSCEEQINVLRLSQTENCATKRLFGVMIWYT